MTNHESSVVKWGNYRKNKGMIKQIIFLLFYFLIAISAKAKTSSCEIFNQAKDVPLTYAQLFKIKKDEKTKITFVGLKRKTEDQSFRWWALSSDVDKVKKYFDNCSDIKLKKFPKRAISTSTTHLSFLSDIGAIDQLAAFTQTSMISGEVWKKRVKDKKIENLPLTLNVEHFIKGKFDLLLTYPESSFDDLISSLNQRNDQRNDLRNVTLFSIVEYQEEKALARMEWIKFFGAVFDSLDKANEVFNQREKTYWNVVKLIKGQKKLKSPLIMMGEVLNSKWVYPSSKSDFMNLCNDLQVTVVKPVVQSNIRKNIGPDFFHLEEMLSIKNKPEYWVLTSAYFDKQDLLKKHPIYKNFSNKFIIALKKDPDEKRGFHSFWEEGINRPDQLVQDLAKFFYPEIFAKYQSVWFNKLL